MDVRRYATETVQFFANPKKAERERVAVGGFLRAIGVSFNDAEIQSGRPEPVDVAFRSACFQLMDIVGKKKRGEEWGDRLRRSEEAECLTELIEPYSPSKPITFTQLSRTVADRLRRKAARYGGVGCSLLDALVYFDIEDRHIHPVDFEMDERTVAALSRQGWRSVSVLAPPYGAVLLARAGVPDFLQSTRGQLLRKWPGDGLFKEAAAIHFDKAMHSLARCIAEAAPLNQA